MGISRLTANFSSEPLSQATSTASFSQAIIVERWKHIIDVSFLQLFYKERKEKYGRGSEGNCLPLSSQNFLPLLSNLPFFSLSTKATSIKVNLLS